MSLGPLMIDLETTQVLDHERELLQHPYVGGVILFTRNYRSVTQITELIAQIRAVRPEVLITVDHEGGRVQRFRAGFTQIPAAGKFGQYYDRNPQAAKILAQTAGWVLAAELRRVDVDLSFTPDLDLDWRKSEVIGDRAFHRDPRIVIELATAFVEGMQRAGMQAVGKHYPGHGFVEVDSHVGIPVDERSLNELKKDDLIPFQHLINTGILAGIMPAHIIYPAVDDVPAGFSKVWLDMLRNKLKFSGIIFSDDLSMEGASSIGGYTARAEQALAAGCDMILVCNHREGVLEIMKNLKYQIPTDLNARITKLRGTSPIDYQSLSDDEAWQEGVAVLAQL